MHNKGRVFQLFFTVSVHILLLQSVNSSVNAEAFGSNRTVIKVSQDGKDNIACWRNNSSPCKTVAFAFHSPALNHTTVILSEGVHELGEVIIINNVQDLILQGTTSSISRSAIACTKKNSGFSFLENKGLIINELSIENCGSNHTSTSRINGKSLPLFTSLFLQKCYTVSLTNVTIKGSDGMGAVFYDVGGNVLLNYVNIRNCKEHIYSYSQGFSSGGGLYVEFTEKEGKTTSLFNSNSFYSFRNCAFQSNVAEHDYSRPSVENDSKNFVSFGRGGGLSLILQGFGTNNSFLVRHCHFQNNTALWGAGLFAEFHENSGNNSIKVQDTNFMWNKASYGGGGIRTGFASNNTLGSNLISLENCNFIENIAQLGGGYSQYRVSKSGIENELTKFYSCNFSGNKAYLGTGMHMSVSWFEMYNTNITNNTVTDYEEKTSGKGALYLFSSKGILKNGNIFQNNIWTALVIEFSILEFFDDVQFLRNTGIKGGAIAAYGDSYIILREKSRINFIGNKAIRLGGAFYVKTPGPPMSPMNSTEFMVYRCGILFGNEENHLETFDTQVKFINNTAPKASGKSVFMSTLNWCRDYGEPKYNNSALQWGNFVYEPRNSEPHIVTNPLIIEMYVSDWDKAPGMKFQPRLVLRDELWNSTFGTVKVKISSPDPSVRLVGSDVFAVKDVLPNISLVGHELSAFNVTIETVVGVTVRMRLLNRRLLKCPYGYFQGKNDLVCKCLSSQGLESGVTRCQEDKIFVLRGRWGNAKGSNLNFAKHHCPRSYCERCKGEDGKPSDTECMYHKATQCGPNRRWDSVLCGSCKKGYSVNLGNEDCAKCSNEGLFWLLLWILALTVFVLIIMLLNIKHYFTYLNAYLYSYQVLPLLLVGNHYLDNFISFVMGLSNFSGTGGNFGVCLWDGMTDLQKLTLNYLTPTYILLCTGFIGFISFHCKWCPFNKKSALRALALLSIFAYADFTRITFELLHYVNVDGKAVLYLQGDVGYFGAEHTPYAVAAIIVLLIVVLLFPLALIFFPWVIGSFVKLKGIFDSFQEPFKEGYERFASFYLLCRCLVFAIFVFLENGVIRDTLLAICCELILIVFLLMKPYNEEKINYFDTLLLANVAFVGTINIALNAITEKENRRGLQITAAVLTYLPFVCIFLQLSHWGFFALKRYMARRRYQNEGMKPTRINAAKLPHRALETEEDDQQQCGQQLYETASDMGTGDQSHQSIPYYAYDGDSYKF